MNCPCCGAAETIRVRVCSQCGAVYTTEELQELRQLEFLLNETSSWAIDENQRKPYLDHLEALKAKLLISPALKEPSTAFSPAPVISPASSQISQPADVLEVKTQSAQRAHTSPPPSGVTPPISLEPPATPPNPPRETIPFDQWLLSERNIKIALYSGGLLLFLAGIIFVSVNWTRLSGIAKFTVTLVITGVAYLAGMMLHRRPILRIGGIAILAIATTFLPLNFTVLQIYIFGPSGFSQNWMWVIASIVVLIASLTTAYFTRAKLFTYFGLISIASLVLSFLALIRIQGEKLYEPVFGSDLPFMAYGTAFALLALLFFITAQLLRSSRFADFSLQPLLIVSTAGGIVLFAAIVFQYLTNACTSVRLFCSAGSPWLALSGMAILLSLFTLRTWWKTTRYDCAIAVTIFLPTYAFFIAELKLISTLSSLLMLLAGFCLIGLGHWVNLRSWKLYTRIPLYIGGYLQVAFLTLLAVTRYSQDPFDLAKSLFADTLILILSYRIFRAKLLLYLSAFMFIFPVTITTYVYAPAWINLNDVLMTLILIYLSIAYVYRQRFLHLSRACLLSSALLAVFTPIYTFATNHPLSAMMGLVLFADVVFLIGSYLILFAQPLVYGAVVLFLLPALIYINRWFALQYQYIAIALMLAYLALAYLLWNRNKHFSRAFLLGTVLMAIYLPIHAAAIDTLQIAHALLADVLAIMVISWLTRARVLIYFATTLLIIPVWIYARQYYSSLEDTGNVLMLLFLIYAACVYYFSKKIRWLAYPFLVNTILLSIIIPTIFTIFNLFDEHVIRNVFFVRSLLLISLTYFILGWRLYWFSLHFPALLALDLSILPLVYYAFPTAKSSLLLEAGNYLLYGVGLVLSLVGLWIRKKGWKNWWIPYYLFTVINLFISYNLLYSVTRSSEFILLVILAVLMFFLGWFESKAIDTSLRAIFRYKQTTILPVFSFLGCLFLFRGIFPLEQLVQQSPNYWPTWGAVLATIFISTHWIRTGEYVRKVYTSAFRLCGMVLLIISAGCAVFLYSPIYLMMVLSLSGAVFGIDAWFHRNRFIAYLAAASLLGAYFALLVYRNIDNHQAFTIPIGLLLISISLNEKRFGRKIIFYFLAYSGLLTLIGSAFLESFSNVIYAAILLVESILLIMWGVKVHSRGFVLSGAVALITNGITQYGPGFIELPRWVQLGIVGVVLLGLGLLALFRREQLIQMRRSVADKWMHWEA